MRWLPPARPKVITRGRGTLFGEGDIGEGQRWGAGKLDSVSLLWGEEGGCVLISVFEQIGHLVNFFFLNSLSEINIHASL